MDDAQELSPNPHHSGGLKKVFSRSSRSQTTQAQDAESIQGSARSNDRSSADSSTLDKRPATAGGELTVEDSPKRLSKLLSSRRRKKNNNNKPTESTPSTDSLVEDDDDEPAGPFPPLPSEEYVPSQSPGHGNAAGLNHSTASINLLADDSEADQ